MNLSKDMDMRRFIIILSLLSVMILVIGAAQAQFGRAVACGDLAEEDCNLLNRSQSAMAELTSAEFDLAVDLSLIGLAGDEPATFTLTGDGAFSGDISPFFTEPEDPAAMMADPVSSLREFANIIENVDARLNLIVGLPDQMGAMMGDVPSEIPLELLLVDGVGYFNFDTLAGIAGDDAAMLPQGWQGLDLSGALDMGIMMAESQMDAMDDMEMFSMDMDALAQLQSPQFLNQYTMINREADSTTSDGDAVAVFTTTYDFEGLVSDPAFADLMRSAAEAQGEDIDEDAMDEAMDEAMDMMNQVLGGLTYSLTTSIGVDDALVRSVATHIDLDFSGIDDAKLAREVGEARFTLNAEINFRAFDNAAPITAPEGAPVNTVQDLMRMGMGGGQMATPIPMMTPTFTPDGAAIATATPGPTGEGTAEVTPPVSPPVTGTLPASTDVPATDPVIDLTVAITIEPPIVPTQ